MNMQGTSLFGMKIAEVFSLIYENREEGRASAVCTRTLSGDAVLRSPANACKGADPWQKLRH